MQKPQIPANESDRQAALERYNILDTFPESVYDDLTRLAADICDTPIALISLVDRDRQWFKSRFGIDVSETSRDISFCTHTIVSGQTLIVPDALKDARFANNPLVLQEPKIRFYGGVPLITPDNYVLGTLCVIDRQPKQLTQKKIKQLETLGRLVISQLELKLQEDTSQKFQDRLSKIGMFQQAILDSANFSIISTDLQGVIQSFNAGAEALLGYTEAEMLGKTPINFHDLQEVVERSHILSAELQQTIEAGFAVFTAKAKLGKVSEEEWTYIHKDGSRIPVMLSITAIRNHQGEITGFLGIAKDITAQKQAEAEIRANNEKIVNFNLELIRANQLKDEFLAIVSHELRTPLNAVLGMAESLQEEVFGSINPRQFKALETIDRSANHLLRLIDDILDLTNITAGRLSLNIDASDASDINQICQNSLDIIEQSVGQKNLQLTYKIQPDLPSVQIDAGRTEQVLVNLLENAVKFTPENGSIGLTVDLYGEVTDKGDRLNPSYWLRFRVSDTGIGIASENLSQLFQPFIQVDSALNRQYDGIGIGLAISKKIVELHGGKISVSSTLGQGSCFTVELPLKDVFIPSLSQSVAELLPTHTSPIPTSPLILLAEDNQANCITIVAYLSAKGYRINLANDGQEAIAMAKSDRPDLILMDIQMPNVDGIEAIKQIRLDPNVAHIPIIALTALAMVGDRERCLAAGANEYLSKPIKLKQLVSVIQQFLSPL